MGTFAKKRMVEMDKEYVKKGLRWLIEASRGTKTLISTITCLEKVRCQCGHGHTHYSYTKVLKDLKSWHEDQVKRLRMKRDHMKRDGKWNSQAYPTVRRKPDTNG